MDLSVADVLALEIGDFVTAGVGRGFNVDEVVVVVVLAVVALKMKIFSIAKNFNQNEVQRTFLALQQL